MRDLSSLVIGRNPVIEALKSEREIDRLLVAKGAEGSIKKVVALAKERKINISYRDGQEIDRLVNGKNHQGVVAYVSAYKYSSVDEILKYAESKNELPFIVILDGIEDPHNLGAIMRTAEICGVHGIIIPKRRTALITDTVAKVSAGAVEHIRCAKVANIANTIDDLKNKGVWIYQCNMGGSNYYETDMKGSVAIVIGNEGKGVSRLVAEKCDFTVSIPMYGNVYSLNASNAAAVVLCEVAKQKNQVK